MNRLSAMGELHEALRQCLARADSLEVPLAAAYICQALELLERELIAARLFPDVLKEKHANG